MHEHKSWQDDNNHNEELHCILIHGTFSDNAAPWIKEGSFLRSELAQLAKGETLFSDFNWSGGNTQRARAEAANLLSNRLKLEAANFPARKFLLIGHSHGGNVALHAISGVPISQRAGVVCLATPFIHIHPRSKQMMYWIWVGIWAIVAGILWGEGLELILAISNKLSEISPLAKIDRWFYSTIPLSGYLAKIWGAFWGCVFAVFVLAFCILGAAFCRGDSLLSGQEQAIARWQTLRPCDVPTLCIWYAPDEAYWVIRILRNTVESIHKMVALYSKYGAYSVMIAATITAIWFAWQSGISAPASSALIHASSVAAKLLGYAGAILVTIPALLWTLAFLVSVITVWPALGSFAASDHLWMNIQPKRFPQIAANYITQKELGIFDKGWFLNITVTFPFLSGKWVHCRVYEDHRAASTIRAWYSGIRP